MTICKKLKSEMKNGKIITAYEERHKPHFVPEYAIYVMKADGNLPYYTVRAARTTWRKKYNELLAEM